MSQHAERRRYCQNKPPWVSGFTLAAAPLSLSLSGDQTWPCRPCNMVNLQWMSIVISKPTSDAISIALCHPSGDPANYGPIAVGEPLYRLYTIILIDRLVAWSEEHGLRSPVQAGFRPRQSPIHHLFALRHFIDRAILQQRPLFVSFVDLQKAYDTVQHGLLWARLEGIGVGPKMLAAIKSL